MSSASLREWCGGISEAKKIASRAEAHYLPVASAHVAANFTNLCILESVRQHYLDKYRGLVTTTLPVANGVVPLPEGPRLGVEPTQVFARTDVTVERINA